MFSMIGAAYLSCDTYVYFSVFFLQNFMTCKSIAYIFFLLATYNQKAIIKVKAAKVRCYLKISIARIKKRRKIAYFFEECLNIYFHF